MKIDVEEMLDGTKNLKLRGSTLIEGFDWRNLWI